MRATSSRLNLPESRRSSSGLKSEAYGDDVYTTDCHRPTRYLLYNFGSSFSCAKSLLMHEEDVSIYRGKEQNMIKGKQ